MTDTGVEQWDVVVVGGGAAGLSTAVTLARSRRTVLVVDAGELRNAPADGVHNYLGREGTAPGDLVTAGRREVESYGGVVRTGRVVAARGEAPGFVLDLEDGTVLGARRVVVASGAVDELPAVEGLAARWGRDVLHCPYCHGWEVRDRRVGVLATSALAMHHVGLVGQLTDDVVLFTNGAFAPDRHQRGELRARGVEVVAGEVAAVDVVDDTLRGVRLADGTTIALDALLTATRVHARGEVAAMLGAAPVEQRMGDVVLGTVVPADAQGRTPVAGLWAAGNVTDLRATVIAAAAAGQSVAAQVNADLVESDVRLAVQAARDGSPRFWQKFYADADQVWSGWVNLRLPEVVEGLAPGTALDLGAGEGGDAVWLAGRGWKVTAVDVAQAACDRIAAAAGDLPVTTERHDLTETFPEGTFDLISAQYLHSPNDDFPRIAILRRAAEAVAPGGTLAVVGHGRLPSRAWDPTLTMPTAREVHDDLALDPTVWTVVRCDAPEREVDHDGHTETITDEVLVMRRT